MLELRSSCNNGSRQAQHLTSKEEEEEVAEEEEEEEEDHCQRSPPCTVGVGIDRSVGR